MRILTCLLFIVSLAACGGGGGSGLVGPPVGSAECQNDGQKQFVLDSLYTWYLWNDLLPVGISISDYATPEELVREVTRTFGPQKVNGDPLDLFSSVGSAQADAEFFGEGKFEGFGFSYRTIDTATSDVRLSRVFASSPADNGGLERGQQFVSVDGRSIVDILANEGIGAAFTNDTVIFEMRRIDGSVFSTTITKAVVTIPPVPQWRVIDRGAGVPPVGYLELSTFISTANPVFDTVFAEFIAAGVTDVIIDLRYNGGGLVSTANLLGDYLGALANDGFVFSETQFNADRAPANNSTDFFSRLGNSINLSKLAVIASGGTASASELVTNSLDAYFDVGIIGANTFGKPVGQIGITFCEKILRPTSFKTVNALGEGEYFDGLPVDCPAPDDLNEVVGADTDPNLIAALSYLNTGACPVTAGPGDQFKVEGEYVDRPELFGPAHREFANAF
ncbi:MAG: S41 family peptidase [Woeseiaceae bacterium]